MFTASRPQSKFGALLILLVAGSPLLADDGDGDPTFGDQGLVAVGWNGGVDIARGRAAASLADGSLLVAGEVATGIGNGAFGIVKLGPTGLLNIGFGTGGFTRFAFSDDVDRINNLGDIVELPGGSILLAGSTQVDGPVVPEDLIYVPAVAKLTSGGRSRPFVRNRRSEDRLPAVAEREHLLSAADSPTRRETPVRRQLLPMSGQ